MSRTSRPHDNTVIELLRADPSLSDEYLAVAIEEADMEGGFEALLAALRHVAKAQCVASIAKRSRIPGASTFSAHSSSSNLGIKTLLAALYMDDK